MLRFIKKSNHLKANFLQKNPSAGTGETIRCFVLLWKTMSSFGCLHRDNNSYTGTSLGSRFLSSFKLTLRNEFPESVIHIDYDRYCYSYRIRRLFVFQQAIRHVSPIPAKDAFDKNNHRNLEKELRKKVWKSNTSKKEILRRGQIYHIWTWPNLFILGFLFLFFAHKKTTGKPVVSKLILIIV